MLIHFHDRARPNKYNLEAPAWLNLMEPQNVFFSFMTLPPQLLRSFSVSLENTSKRGSLISGTFPNTFYSAQV